MQTRRHLDVLGTGRLKAALRHALVIAQFHFYRFRLAGQPMIAPRHASGTVTQEKQVHVPA